LPDPGSCVHRAYRQIWRDPEGLGPAIDEAQLFNFEGTYEFIRPRRRADVDHCRRVVVYSGFVQIFVSLNDDLAVQIRLAEEVVAASVVALVRRKRGTRDELDDKSGVV